MPRMQILTPAEATAFETPPVFRPTEREKFFQISDSLSFVLPTSPSGQLRSTVFTSC